MKEFKNLIVLGPLIYAIHHFEEHIIFNFREWRLSYFPDNNPSSTEEILIRLISLLLIVVFVHLIKNNKGSAHLVLFFLMATQVVNALFHIFFSFYYYDFSPGAITATLLYLPINFLIIRAAFEENFLKSYLELFILFVMGMTTFTLFELIGPEIIKYTVILSPLYYIMINKIEKRNAIV
tara:strand:+ start:395 stop:934 length:540 start_codon:yes stop_codon:yes gene_type:complete